MERSRQVEILNRVLHDTINSVVQYIEVAVPYVPDGYAERYEEILACKNEEVASANALNDAIAALDGVPRVGVFPYWNVDLNYLDLRFLARFAAEHQEKTIERAEQALAELRDDPSLHPLLKRIVAEKRRHLDVLLAVGAIAEPEAPAATEES